MKHKKLMMVSFTYASNDMYIYEVMDNKPIDKEEFKAYLVDAEGYNDEVGQIIYIVQQTVQVDLESWRDLVKQDHELDALKHKFVDTMLEAWDNTLDEHYWRNPEGDIDSVARMDWEGMWAFAKESLIKEMEDHTQEQVEAEIRQAGFDFLIDGSK